MFSRRSASISILFFFTLFASASQAGMMEDLKAIHSGFSNDLQRAFGAFCQLRNSGNLDRSSVEKLLTTHGFKLEQLEKINTDTSLLYDNFPDKKRVVLLFRKDNPAIIVSDTSNRLQFRLAYLHINTEEENCAVEQARYYANGEVVYLSVYWGKQRFDFVDTGDTKLLNDAVPIGVIDDGFDVDHQNLLPYLLRDGSGSIDFYDALAPEGEAVLSPHGTHVAGIVSRQSPRLAIIPINYFNLLATGFEPERKFVPVQNELTRYITEITNSRQYQAVYFAHSRGARLINMSLGFDLVSNSRELRRLNQSENVTAKGDTDGFQIAFEQFPDITFVIGAGNNGKELEPGDERGGFLGGHTSPNIISVAAIDDENKLAEFSTYGKHLVDLAAPGVEINSLGASILQGLPKGYGGPDSEGMMRMSGTSMATPYVTHLLGEMLYIKRDMTPSELKEYICLTVVKTRELRDKVRCGGYVDKERTMAFFQKYKKVEQLQIMRSLTGDNGRFTDREQRNAGRKLRLDSFHLALKEDRVEAQNFVFFEDGHAFSDSVLDLGGRGLKPEVLTKPFTSVRHHFFTDDKGRIGFIGYFTVREKYKLGRYMFVSHPNGGPRHKISLDRPSELRGLSITGSVHKIYRDESYSDIGRQRLGEIWDADLLQRYPAVSNFRIRER